MPTAATAATPAAAMAVLIGLADSPVDVLSVDSKLNKAAVFWLVEFGLGTSAEENSKFKIGNVAGAMTFRRMTPSRTLIVSAT